MTQPHCCLKFGNKIGLNFELHAVLTIKYVFLPLGNQIVLLKRSDALTNQN